MVIQSFFYPKPDDVIDEDWKMRRMIAMPTFLGYFNHGLLNYEEQIIERVKEYFSPFNEEIKNNFKLEVEDFINIYNYIDKLPNEFLNQKRWAADLGRILRRNERKKSHALGMAGASSTTLSRFI